MMKEPLFSKEQVEMLYKDALTAYLYDENRLIKVSCNNYHHKDAVCYTGNGDIWHLTYKGIWKKDYKQKII